ncbi:phosphotransferase enzyme family protein [Colletotrichum truncatum]|uniref:Phosphotransferase enzyme family protein n=1 Tax=Colletotrichum truncatum TaxID=5467 RepID=A0ACC3YNT8_COLTU|nr:phosphotransferase enzyme family protein [Colletotrichum truncatum]KAF6794132.1 phosphotransferase enzyme family protein [Colletotrichum truncatum]
MEIAETKLPSPVGEKPLSARIRESWESGRFCFNLASRSSFDVDEIYWKALHKDGIGERLLDKTTIEEKGRFLKLKKEQLDDYCREKEMTRVSGGSIRRH